MAGIDDTGEAMTAHDSKEALSTSETPHTSSSSPNFHQTEGSDVSAPVKPECLRKVKQDPEGKLDKQQTSTSTPARAHARKRGRPSKEKHTNASSTEGKAPLKRKRVRKLRCLPFVRQKIEEKTKDVIVRLYLCDSVKGDMERISAEERKLGFVPAHTKMDVLVKPTKRKLRLECCINSSKEQKDLSYDLISGSPHNLVPFKVKYKNKTDVVSLKVGQYANLAVEFLFSIDVGDHQNTSDASLPFEGQGMSTASPSSTKDTVWQGLEKVTDQQITKLAELLSPDAYSKLCHELGIEYNLSCQILEKHQTNCTAACKDVLHKWKDDTGGPVKLLDEALVSCRLGGLISKYKEKE